LISFTWMPMMITQILLIAWPVNLSKEDGLYLLSRRDEGKASLRQYISSFYFLDYLFLLMNSG
jgi:hypothetical protein